MIRTDIDIKDDLYGWIAGSTLAGLVSGEVYKDQRPLNSDKEDIVISVLARDAGAQVQRVTVNVNIYVPDIRRGRESVENLPRLREVSAEAAGEFEYRQTSDAVYVLDRQEIFKANGIDWHVINNRLDIRYSNETT